MYAIAICDDEPSDLQKLSTLLQRYLQAYGIEAQVVEFSHPDALLTEEQDFDLYLLDVVMPMHTGIDVGRFLRERNNKGQILYVTSSLEFAVDAFAVQATHYVLKPYTNEQFTEALERVFRAIPTQRPKQIRLKTEDGELYNLGIQEISYAESNNHTVMIHTEGQTFATRRTLSALLAELDALVPNTFICPYKGYLVNQNAIRSIHKDSITVNDGAKIPIPKRSYKALQDGYMRFLFDDKKEDLL